MPNAARTDARIILEQLERGDTSPVWDALTDERRSANQPEALGRWASALDRWIGSPRRLIDVTYPWGDAGLALEGAYGTLAVTARFDGDRLDDIELRPIVADGILNIVVGCPGGSWNEEAKRVEGEPRSLAMFYGELLGMRIIRDDWIKLGIERGRTPQLAFGDGWSDVRPPRWPDPEYPHHLHLDLYTDDPDATERLAVERGARSVQRNGDHRILSDPFGHPFCIYRDREARSGTAAPARLGRLVFDCPDPRALAPFYEGLLDMQQRIEDTEERVVIRRDDGTLPAIAFQLVTPYVAPRWHDPAFPQPVHLDLWFNDIEAARRHAEELGATLLPPPRGSCPVYADPAGHPFCLCSNAGGEETYTATLFGEW